MKPSELLTPDNWIKQAECRDIHGVRVLASNPAAAKFCLSGVIKRAAILPHLVEDSDTYAGSKKRALLKIDRAFTKVKNIIAKKFPYFAMLNSSNVDTIIKFNDYPETTFKQVHSVLVEAGL